MMAALFFLFLAGSFAFAFGPGDRLQATSAANIRSGPSTSHQILDTTTAGDLGVIVSGPYYGSGFVWYSNRWDSHLSGYSATINLQAIPPLAPILVSPGNSDSNNPPVMTNSSPTMTWGIPMGATNFGLYLRDLDTGVMVYSNDYVGYYSGLTFTSGWIIAGHTYKWNMTASDSAGFSEVSKPSLFFRFVPPPIISTLSASSITSTSAVFRGSVNPKGTIAYTYFQYGTTISYGIPIGQANITNDLNSFWNVWFTNTSLVPNTTYHYQFLAVNDGGSYGGDDVFFTTLGSNPNTPANLIASNLATGIFLSWRDNSTNETGFYIQRRQGSSYTYFSLAANQTNYTDTSVSSGNTYCYSVAATNSSGSSAFTSEQCATYSVSGSAPVAQIIGDLRPVTGSTRYYGSASSGSTPLKYSWSTGAGQTSTEANPTFLFNSPGTNWIRLIVTDTYQHSGFASIDINVQGANNGVTPTSSLGADPVVLASGNYIQSHVDIKLPGKGVPFEFRRFYNSKSSDQSGKPLGFGWTFSYNAKIQDNGTNVLVVQGDGSTWTYSFSDGAYIGEPGVYDALVKTNGVWTLTDKSQTVTCFDGTNGQLISITDKNFNTLTCSYAGGVLSAVTNSAGRSVVFTTNEIGCLASMTDQISRTIWFQYDFHTNLSTVINANGYTNTYEYNDYHQMTGATDGRGVFYIHNGYDTNTFVVLKQCDAYTNWTYFAYDFTNRITIQTNALGGISTHYFDTNLLETKVIDEAGNQQIFAYDSNRNRVYIKDKNGNETRFGYDALGNVTNKVDALTNTTVIEYDARNNPGRRINALSSITTFGYDERGNLTSTTNALGFTTAVEYDSNGLPLTLWDARGYGTTNGYDNQGNLVTVANARGAVIRYEYDLAGRKVRQIDALNHTNSFLYDDNDNLLAATNALGFTTIFTYDGNNNQLSVQNSSGATTTNIYDLKDRLVSILGPLFRTNGFSYDALDRKIVSWDALGNRTGYEYDNVGNVVAITNALDEVTRFGYDPQGNQTAVIDPEGYIVDSVYDPLNRKVATINSLISSTNLTFYDPLGRIAAVTNANNQATRFFYDAIGRLTNVVDAAGQSVLFGYDNNGNRTLTTDPNGHTWTKVFDELNQLAEQYDPLGNKTLLEYDPVGNLARKVTPNNISIVYLYDAANQLTNITYPSGSPVRFTYDAVGNRTKMTDGTGSTTWKYDLLNRPTNVVDRFGVSVFNDFDANGNRIGLKYAAGKTVTYQFDKLNRMVGLTNWLGGVVSYWYDRRGNLTSSLNSDGSWVVYSYDAANRLTGQTNFTANSFEPLALYALTLDGIGNHREMTSQQPLFPILTSQTNQYSYDSDNRLLSVDSQTVTSDTNGNITTIGSDVFKYDTEDRLNRISIGNTNTIYVCNYDGLGNRLTATIRGKPRQFGLDRLGTLSQVLIEKTNNIAVAYYVYGLGLAQRIRSDGAVANYQYDIRGNTIALTDANGNVTDSYAYDSFGNLANSEGYSAQPFRYLGRYGIIDDSTGLLYARARYFSPQLGRFLTKDPITGKDSDGQSLNRYVYVLNCPLRLFDASGLSSQDKLNFNFGKNVTWNVANSTPYITDDSSLGIVHILLDGCGLLEGPGIFCDGANGIIYLLEGDSVNAALSGGAMIPGVGIAATVGKYGAKAVKTGAANAANAARLRTQLTAEEIASGHAFDKHVIQGGEFSGITTRPQFSGQIESVINNASDVKVLSNGRTAYWDSSSGTVVIRNPSAVDGGTAFKPTQGKTYFDNLK